MNESRCNSNILFEHEKSRQCVIIDLTSSSEGYDVRSSLDAKFISFQKVNEERYENGSLHSSSPKSVNGFPSMYQDTYEQGEQKAQNLEKITVDDCETDDVSWPQRMPKVERQKCQWGKMIEDADWTDLFESLTRCKRQRTLLTEEMIIYSERCTTVLHVAAHKAPSELMLLLLDVITTCCDSYQYGSQQDNRETTGTEASSKNYCLCGDTDGNTPLHIVCANLKRTPTRGSEQVTIDFSVVKNLLVLGPEALVMQNRNGDTPLHLLLASKALQQPDDIKTMRNAVTAAVEALTAFLGMAKDMALKQNVNGLTPLHVAIANHCPKGILLKLLIAVPKAVTIADNDGMNSLHYVASFGVQSWTFVEQLITAYPELIHQQTIHGDTPLHLLIANTSLAYFPGMSQTLCKALTYNNNRHTMKLLTVLSGENCDNPPILVQNAHGDTPLHFCAKMNAPAVLTQALMESLHAPMASTLSAEVDMTPLRIAMLTLCRVGDSHDAVGLRNAMSNVVALATPEACETVDSHGLTPLMHAVQNKKWSACLVKIMLQVDRDCVKQTTPNGLLALHYACQNKNLKSTTLQGSYPFTSFGLYLSENGTLENVTNSFFPLC